MNETEICRTHNSSGRQSVTSWQSWYNLPCCYFKNWTRFIRARIVLGETSRAGFKPGITGTLPHNSLSQVPCSPSAPQHWVQKRLVQPHRVCHIQVCVCHTQRCVHSDRFFPYHLRHRWSQPQYLSNLKIQACINKCNTEIGQKAGGGEEDINKSVNEVICYALRVVLIVAESEDVFMTQIWQAHSKCAN